MTPADLKALRSRLGLTQKELAEAVGVSRRTVVYWEHGERNVSAPTEKLLRLMLRAQAIQERSEPT